jgi:hypothetical protein
MENRFNISVSNQPSNVNETLSKVIHLIKEYRNKINRMMNDPDFDTKILFKTITPKAVKHEISYFIQGDQINTDPEVVKQKVFEHYNNQFSNVTLQKISTPF